jgi:hypothetical protein
MQFTADQVWGLAVAADRINGGYFKESYWECPAPKFDAVKIKEANKVMVKTWLAQNDFSQMTNEDIEKGQAFRNHFKGYLFKSLSKKISGFEQSALKIAQMETFNGSNLLEFAIISCLPASARRDKESLAHQREVIASTQLEGLPGQKIISEVQIIKCSFNQNYNKYRITGLMGESFVDFWYKSELQGQVKIKGKIKAHRENNTTQLHYVSIA